MSTNGSAAITHMEPAIQAPVLELRDIHAGYGDTLVLHGVSLTLAQRSVLALLGPNGAGKTTLLRVISGLLPAKRGEVVLAGEAVTTMKPHQRVRRGLCHIPESRGIYPTLTVRENLVLFTLDKDEEHAIEHAVASFPILGEKLNQTAGQLSGGQQQMLAIVRSYIANPRLVLVDEASMGLAPVVVDQIYDYLAGIVAEGTSLLLVEQYVRRALDAADSVVILTKGRIAFTGAASDVGDDVFQHYLGTAASAN
jgi:branched-chain amino acid transport system ATP-binding protein